MKKNNIDWEMIGLGIVTILCMVVLAVAAGVFSGCTASRPYINPPATAPWDLGPCEQNLGAIKVEGVPVDPKAVVAALEELAARWPGLEPFPCPARRRQMEVVFVPKPPYPGWAGELDIYGTVLVLIDAKHPTIGVSALTHEMTHWALWRTTAFPDAQHGEGPGRHTWFPEHTKAIDDSDRALRARGL